MVSLAAATYCVAVPISVINPLQIKASKTTHFWNLENFGDNMIEPREAAFEKAWDAISKLPRDSIGDTFYQRPDTASISGREAWLSAAEYLEELSHENDYIRFWVRDAYVALGDFETALSLCKEYKLGSRHSAQAGKKVSLKWELGLPITGSDLIGLFGPQLTKFGKENIEPVTEFLSIRLKALQEKECRSFYDEWIEDAHELEHGYTLFNGHASHMVTKPPRGVSFDLSERAKKFAKQAIRDAENTWREENSIPLVGEGWVSETALYYEVKAAFPSLKVMQHASPAWLGRQHLDIFIEELSVGIEYQGIQHDKPVSFFGGEEAYQKTVKRDRAKKNKCSRNGVRLIYVREGYQIHDLVKQILS